MGQLILGVQALGKFPPHGRGKTSKNPGQFATSIFPIEIELI